MPPTPFCHTVLTEEALTSYLQLTPLPDTGFYLLQVDEFVEEEAEGLRAKAEEGKAELDKLADLQKLRADVAFNSALAGLWAGWAALC
jgi:hypothetical protein